MSLEVPNEICTAIVKQVKTVQDWGRLQRVSRAFYAIVHAECWSQIKQLNIQISDRQVDLEFNGQGCLVLSDANLLLFMEALAKKSTKIQTVSLKIAGETEGTGGMVLKLLVSFSLPVRKVDMDITRTPVHHLTDLVTAICGTLESLSIRFSGRITSPELHEAFRNCHALKTIDIRTQDREMIESLLHGKTQLKTIQMTHCMGHLFPASAWFNTGAHLSTCLFGYDGCYLLEAYKRAMHQRNLMADHPLKTLTCLTLNRLPYFTGLFQLLPDLKQLTLLELQSNTGDLNTVVRKFLGRYRETSGNGRFLNMEICMAQPLSGSPAILEQMICPVVESVEQKEGTQEITFVRGNAAVKAKIKTANEDAKLFYGTLGLF